MSSSSLPRPLSPQQPQGSPQQPTSSPFTPAFGSEFPVTSLPQPPSSLPPLPQQLREPVSCPLTKTGDKRTVYYMNSFLGCKYYASCSVNNHIVTVMIDTGADCSCFPPALLNGAPVVKMEDSVRIFGFHASSEPHIVDEMVPLELNFEPGKINANFMVCETANNIPIIGADILRSNVGISIDTSSDLLTVKHDVIHVKPSIRSSKKEYLRRKKWE